MNNNAAQTITGYNMCKKTFSAARTNWRCNTAKGPAPGWAMLPILICSAIALAIVLERCWTLRRKSVLPPGLGEEVRNWARSGQLDPAHLATLANGSPLGELLAAALAVRNRPRELIKERIEDTGRHVVHNMERYLNTLGTIALIGPLLGLLGTVIGLIRMFMDVMKGGVGDPLKMAGTLGYWLIGLHAVAGLYHHYVVRDNTLLRMMPSAFQPILQGHGLCGTGRPSS